MSFSNKKGQALVEFVIILPIFIFMIFACIDIGKVLYMQNKLESRMDDIITSYQKGLTEETIKKDLDLNHQEIILNIEKENVYKRFKLSKKLDMITPGINLILSNPLEVKAERVIYDE
ncbi:MAG: pilus assembly protein [Bacilli bacterium]|nr:pilus assembly protein [Bacilli bacterium]